MTYNVSDAAGNAAVPVKRTVKVTGPEYAVKNAVFKDAAGNILESLPKKGLVMVSADIKSYTGESVPVTIALVLYNKKGEIENLPGITQSVSPGSTESFTAGFMMPGDNSGYLAKLFVTDSLTSLKELSNVASLQQK